MANIANTGWIGKVIWNYDSFTDWLIELLGDAIASKKWNAFELVG